MRLFLAALLLSLSLPAFAQTSGTCQAGTNCTITSDPYPAAATQPAQCRLYNGTGTGSLIVQVAPVGAAGALRCEFVRQFAQGTHVLTARAVDVLGNESDASNTLTISSIGRIQPPANLRKQ